MLNRSFRTVSIYIFFLILEKGTNVIFFSYLAHYFSVSEMGRYNMYIIVYTFASFFCSLEIKSGYTKYYYKYEDKIKQDRLFFSIINFTFILHTVLGLVFIIVLKYFLDLDFLLFFAFILLSFFDVILYLMQCKKRFLEQDFHYGIIIALKVIFTVFYFFLLKSIFNNSIDSKYIIYSILLSYTTVFILIVRQWMFCIDFNIIREISTFSLKILPGNLCVYLTSFAPQIIMNIFSFNQNLIGTFFVYQKMASMLFLLFEPFYLFFSQKFFKHHADNNFFISYQRMFFIIILLFGFLMSIFIIFSEQIISIFAGEKYIEFKNSMLAFLISGYFYIISRILALNINISSKNQYCSYIEISVCILSVVTLTMSSYFSNFLILVYSVAFISFVNFLSFLIVAKMVKPKFFIGYLYFCVQLIIPCIIFFLKSFYDFSMIDKIFISLLLSILYMLRSSFVLKKSFVGIAE